MFISSKKSLPDSGKLLAWIWDQRTTISPFSTSTVSSWPGITFTRSGNTLTITATPEAAAKLAAPQLASAAGTSLEIDPNKVVTVWAATDGGQTAVQVKSTPDPVTAYFKLKAEASGKVLLKKTTNTGKNLGGWNIGLYNDSACTKAVSGSPFTTASDGTISVLNLTPGTYYAREQGVSDPFWVCDQEVKTVQVEAGETATVTFSNIHQGRCKIIKSMPEGESSAGWIFEVYSSDNERMGTYTTADDGTILTDYLLPGDYTVKEILPEDSLFFCKTENPQTVTVVAGQTAEVSFTNSLRPGKISIHKVDPQDNSLAGAKFKLEWSEDGKTWQSIAYSDSADVVKGGCSNPQLVELHRTTGEDGVAEWGNLHPMLYYRITELEAPEGYQLLSEPAFSGKLPEDNLTISLRVVNGPGFALPRTGCYGLSRLPLGILLCLGICAGAAVSLKKKER